MSIEFAKKIYLRLCFLFYIFFQSRHIIIMTDTFSKIKDELLLCYPDITDDELETMTKKLIKYFTLSAKAVYEAKKAETSLRDTDVIKSDICKK